ncbi:RhcC2 [Blastopirellula marina DSM 3645]|uniref:RhcC2 n=1 Tax=Blastopirellula marina DSM 3645 TaxID=314230 RepID=A3ZZ45_9BACT|nr:RhcC2 [Blastopirellula marina DSM 3645]
MGLPAVVMSQDPAFTPQGTAPAKQVAPVPAAAEEETLQAEKQLQRLIASRDALTQEIDRLRKRTGQHSQVFVSVQVFELTHRKTPQANGFAAALAAGGLAEPGPVETGSATVYRVIADDEALKQVVAKLEKSGALKVLAEPTLMTVSGQPASFHVGGEFPIQVPSADGSPAIEFKAYGAEMHVVPVVLGQGRIRLGLRPRISELDPDHGIKLGDLTVPALRVRGVDTSVEMHVGDAFVLAGLVQQRVVTKPQPESGETGPDEQPGLVPGKAAEAHAGRGQTEMEFTELVVIARAKIGAAP